MFLIFIVLEPITLLISFLKLTVFKFQPTSPKQDKKFHEYTVIYGQRREAFPFMDLFRGFISSLLPSICLCLSVSPTPIYLPKLYVFYPHLFQIEELWFTSWLHIQFNIFKTFSNAKASHWPQLKSTIKVNKYHYFKVMYPRTNVFPHEI